MPYLRHYSERILNPFSGTAHNIELNNTRAVCTDGRNWQIQIADEIVKKPWNELSVHGDSGQYLKYGSWSKTSGLSALPLHHTLYRENIDQLLLPLISQLQTSAEKIPFEAQDNYEFWLFDTNNKPVVMLASALDKSSLTIPEQAHWSPFYINETCFKSDFTDSSQRAQDMLINIVQRRLGEKPASAWIKRDKHRHGKIINCRPKKMINNFAIIPNEHFPELMLASDWEDDTAQTLAGDYLDWQAPLLLTLAHLNDVTRKTLEIKAETRPDIVARFHRFYPKVIDSILINKILVEAQLRNAII